MAGILGPDGERYIWVMDPMTRKLKVPLSVIEPTQATAMPGTVPSLCMLFLDGRCRHPCCRQVHISLPVLQQLRKNAQQAPSCCAAHGDTRDNSLLTEKFYQVSIIANSTNSPIPTRYHAPQGNGSFNSSSTMAPQAPAAADSNGSSGSLLTIPAGSIAMTVGLQRYLAQNFGLTRSPQPNHHPAGGTSPLQLPSYPNPPPALNAGSDNDDGGAANGKSILEIPLKMVCRLHMSKKCRYLEDCNNVHICRELEGKLPAAASGGSGLGPQHCADVLQSLKSTSTTATVGNTIYAVSQLATGSITDTDMHQLVTVHKQTYPHLQMRIVDVRISEVGQLTPTMGASNHGGSLNSSTTSNYLQNSPTPGPVQPPAPGYHNNHQPPPGYQARSGHHGYHHGYHAHHHHGGYGGHHHHRDRSSSMNAYESASVPPSGAAFPPSGAPIGANGSFGAIGRPSFGGTDNSSAASLF